MTTLQDIRRFVPISKVVKMAIMDMYEDYDRHEARYTAWAVRGIRKLVREAIKGPTRYSLLKINRNLNNAVLPCEFEEEIGVYLINSCGEKIQLTMNANIVNPTIIEEQECEAGCEEKCGCLPKQLCDDIKKTQVINKILIGETEYDETVTSELLPNGEYYIVTTSPVEDLDAGGIRYDTKKQYITAFDVADCGCIEPTDRNLAKLEAVCWDAYCCHCAPCGNVKSDFGGYQIFKENGTIHFDGGMIGDKAYLEWRGFLPRQGNEILVPEVCFETLVNLVKFKSVENKKGVPRVEREWFWERYLTERGNMMIDLTKVSLADILNAALLVPKFDYIAEDCYSGFIERSAVPAIPQIIYVPQAVSPAPSPATSDKPTIITVQGSEMNGGVTYNNSKLASAYDLRIFANPFNRYLNPGEYTLLPTGGFTILVGTYGVGDWFDIIPKWVL